MTSMTPAGKGMLSTEAARKSFFATVVDLYKSDLAFRGMVDFAVIGAVTLMFINPPHRVQWPWSDAQQDAIRPKPIPPSMNVPNRTTPTPTPGGGGQATVGPVVSIPFMDVLQHPRLGTDSLFDFDQSALSSSRPEDRPRLDAARLAIARADSEGAIEKLREANGDDANVALLRGAALVLQGTPEGNRTAEALWRQAVNAGNIQAKALLGRLLGSGWAGITANAAEAQRLIEAGVASGDRQAMRIAGLGYMSGDFGTLDPTKAAELFKRAADAGDVLAMGLYARVLADGIGIASPDGKQAEQYLRKAADAGLTVAQYTLGTWIIDQFSKGLIASPQEGVDWLKKVHEKGHTIYALNSLAVFHAETAKAPPWKDIPRATDYVRRCSGFAEQACQYNTAYTWEAGHFGSVNLPAARAHYEIARTLNHPTAAGEVKRLDGRLSQAQLAEAQEIERKVRSALKPIPQNILLQYPELSGPPPEAIAPGIPFISVPAQDKGGAGQGASQIGADAALDALRRRAYGHMEAKDYDSAIADFTDIIRQGNATWEDYNQRGMAHHSRRQLDDALEDYGRAISRNGQAYAAYHNRSLIHQEKGDLDSAMADLDSALKGDATNASYYLSRGHINFRRRAFQSAIEDYGKAIDLLTSDKSASNGDKAFAFLMRGKVRVQEAAAQGGKDVSMFMPALLDLEQALLANPNDAEAHFQIGWIADTIGNYRKAIESYTLAVKADPNHTTAYNNRGVIYGNRGQRDLALADYNDAIRADPQNQHAWANRAALFAAARNRKQAIADYRRALEIDPNYDYARNGLRKLGVRP